MTFLIYHSGYDTGVKEGPYNPQAKAGVDVLVRAMQEAGNPGNVVAELGSTWRFVMRDPDQAAHALERHVDDAKDKVAAYFEEQAAD